jgi:DnaK suppressor protein
MQRFRELKEVLEEKRREVLNAIQRSRLAGMEVRQESVPEMGDFVTASVEKEQIFEMGENGVEMLREVEDALERLQAGTYGVCQRCSERIATARLKAIPFARLCVTCQELEERGALA